MKLVSHISEVITVDESPPVVGGLVKSTVDKNATGLIVKLLSNDQIIVLWSTPPKDVHKKFGEIW